MPKEKKERFVVEFPLKTTQQQEDILNKRMEIGRRIYNQVLSIYLKRYNEFSKTKKYRGIMAELRELFEQEEKEGASKMISARKRELYDELGQIYYDNGFTEFKVKDAFIKQSKAFNRHIDTTTAKGIGNRLWASLSTFLYRNGNGLRFCKFGDFNSLEGASNRTGITIRNMDETGGTFDNVYLIWGKTKRTINLQIPVVTNPKSVYEKECFENEIAYSRILRKFYKGREKFYVQIVFKGIPPVKYDTETGEIRHPLGSGTVHLEINNEFVRVKLEDGTVREYDFADRVVDIEKEKQRIHRAMERSRRATNSDKYEENGVAKKLPSDKDNSWVRSNRYMRLLNEWRELERKQKVVRKKQHYQLANEIVSMGDTFIVSSLDFKREQTRRGKLIACKAPAMFISVLERKVTVAGGDFIKG